MNSRKKNAQLNILFGYIAQFGILLLSFIGRRVFLRFLSVDYLGVNGLYSNILTVLSLAELGLDSAVVYSLYKPVADQDTALVYSLLQYFKKIYFILACTIFGIGLALIPFLGFIINSELQYTELVFYYVLFLINTVATYFVAHKVALLSASQQQRIHKIVLLTSNIILQIMHIIVLYIWRNYYAYLGATVVTTIITNIILSRICVRIHKEAFQKQEIVSIDKKPIIDRIKSTLLYKLGAVAVNNTDNLLISILVSTAAVGFYSNYYTVITALQGFIAIVTTSLISGVGNLATTNNKKRLKEVFNLMLFFYHFIAALGGIGFALLFNQLIEIWVGSKYLFDNRTVTIIAVNFYLTNAINPVWMYRESNGLFHQVKYLMLIRAFLNIVFSIVLGKIWGTFGILLATAISLIFSSLWYEPRILYKNIFKISQSDYWKRQGKYCGLTLVSFSICYFICSVLDLPGVVWFALRTVLVALITGIIFLLPNIRSKEFKDLLSMLKF